MFGTVFCFMAIKKKAASHKNVSYFSFPAITQIISYICITDNIDNESGRVLNK